MDWRPVAGRIVLIVGVVLLTAVLGLPLAVRGFVRAIVLLMDGCLWVAMSISTGAGMWSVLMTAGQTIASAFVTQKGSEILIGLLAISLVALYLLQRLLGSEEESFK
jgi:hypothetical protein